MEKKKKILLILLICIVTLLIVGLVYLYNSKYYIIGTWRDLDEIGGDIHFSLNGQVYNSMVYGTYSLLDNHAMKIKVGPQPNRRFQSGEEWDTTLQYSIHGTRLSTTFPSSLARLGKDYTRDYLLGFGITDMEEFKNPTIRDYNKEYVKICTFCGMGKSILESVVLAAMDIFYKN